MTNYATPADRATAEMSDPEAAFSTLWRMLAPADLRDELEYDCIKPVPGRDFRLDWGNRVARVGVEVQGGVYGEKKRGHTRPKKYVEDCWKLAHCLVSGWLVFWVTEEMLKVDPVGFVGLVVGVMRERLAEFGT